LRAKR